MLAPTIDRDSCRPVPVGLAGPALHAVGDVLLDAAGRHAAVERQHLDRRALEDRQDVDRDQEEGQRPRTMNVSDMTVTAYGLPSDARINPFICESLRKTNEMPADARRMADT